MGRSRYEKQWEIEPGNHCLYNLRTGLGIAFDVSKPNHVCITLLAPLLFVSGRLPTGVPTHKMARGRHGRRRLAVKCEISSLCYKSPSPCKHTPRGKKQAPSLRGLHEIFEATRSISFSVRCLLSCHRRFLPSRIAEGGRLQCRGLGWRVRHRRGGSRGGDGSLFPRFGADGNSRPFSLFFLPPTRLGTALPIVRTLIARGSFQGSVRGTPGAPRPRATRDEVLRRGTLPGNPLI